MKIYFKKIKGIYHVWIGESRDEVVIDDSYQRFNSDHHGKIMMYRTIKNLSKDLNLQYEEVE